MHANHHQPLNSACFFRFFSSCRSRICSLRALRGGGSSAGGEGPGVGGGHRDTAAPWLLHAPTRHHMQTGAALQHSLRLRDDLQVLGVLPAEGDGEGAAPRARPAAAAQVVVLACRGGRGCVRTGVGRELCLSTPVEDATSGGGWASRPCTQASAGTGEWRDETSPATSHCCSPGTMESICFLAASVASMLASFCSRVSGISAMPATQLLPSSVSWGQEEEEEQ